MKNRNVGTIIIGIGILMVIIVIIFNIGLKKIITDTCSHGSECTMYDTVVIQTWISVSIVLIILAIGIIIFFTKPKEKIIVKKVKERVKKIDISKLDDDEKKVIKLLQKEEGGMFQRSLMEKLEIGKVKTTRLLDKLESKQLIIRKRRGMNNIVVLKRKLI